MSNWILFLLAILLVTGVASLAIFINVRTFLHFFHIHNREVQTGISAIISLIFLFVLTSGNKLLKPDGDIILLCGAITGISYTARKQLISSEKSNTMSIRRSALTIFFQLSASALVGIALALSLLFLLKLSFPSAFSLLPLTYIPYTPIPTALHSLPLFDQTPPAYVFC